jgi:hypothetical protein
MKNFIKHNIENVKGTRRASSLIEDRRNNTPTKPKFNNNRRTDNSTIDQKVKRL